MGKKQHQKDKLYLTCTEWASQYGGKKVKGDSKKQFKRLPFFCCSITFQPFKDPYCTREGLIFDLVNIMPFLKKFGINPITGKKMSLKELIRLYFHKNAEDKFHCPVTYKVFNENTHIVAIATTGNVYSYDAVERLNIRANNLHDLIDSTPFVRRDIITLQDPTQLDKFNISAFYHVQNNLRLTDNKASTQIRAVNQETKETLAELEKEYKAMPIPGTSAESATKKRDKFNTAHYSTGQAAAAFTSTVMEPVTRVEAAVLEDDTVRYALVKKKGYVRLVTSHGLLNLELHCDVIPKTCENFMKHCKNGYYDDTVFHRLIKHFVLQGGDPTGTGMGGDSIWGGPFTDECRNFLSHEGRGVLSMANSGPNTNKSQFYITLRSCKHLDGKHTVFGKVVGKIDTLNAIEAIETDKDDRPIEEVRLLKCEVFIDPYEEVDQELATERARMTSEEDQKKAANEQPVPRNRREEEALLAKERAKESGQLKAVREGVGKFLSLPSVAEKRGMREDEDSEIVKKKKCKTFKNMLTDFSAW